MSLKDLLAKATSGEIPTVILAIGGVVVFLLACKVTKGLAKIFFALVALALVAGAVWWHFQKH
jgi:hypothetical protein